MKKKELIEALFEQIVELRKELQQIKSSEFFYRETSKYGNNYRGYVYDGLPLKQWLRENNSSVSVNAVHNRLFRGWTLKEAVETPKGEPRHTERN